MRFPPTFLDQIRARVNISSVIGRHVTWDRRKTQAAKGDYWACCPFHGEKSPSFHADDRKGRYHCFGCKASGSVFDFVMKRTVRLKTAEKEFRLPDRVFMPGSDIFPRLAAG